VKKSPRHAGVEPGAPRKIQRVETGVKNLDALLEGGLPSGALVVVSGPPGAGKTILSQQVVFHAASAGRRALYISTLSEPTAKTLRYMSQFRFFDARALEGSVEFVDLGTILHAEGLATMADLVMGHVERFKPDILVLDSFKVFDDLASSRPELRKFGYELAIRLMAWQVTVLLLGEYGPEQLGTTPLFSVVDGILRLSQRQQSGEQQRFLQIVKMRGTAHGRDEHPFQISADGIEVFAQRETIKREDRADEGAVRRLKTGISKLDDILGDGIPLGSSVLACGVAGTGKTVLLLEFLYRGAEAGEKGIMFSFEETPSRLRAAARGLGWDLDAQMAKGLIEIVFVPQPEIQVERDLLMVQERVEALGARRVAIDSVSVFLHKITDLQTNREKVFHLASIVQNAQAVGLFATDIAYGSGQISRFGVEETVVDGVILLTSVEEGLERHRYVEIYKLRNTAHLKGRHSMEIGQGGTTIFPRYGAEAEVDAAPPPVETSRRVSSGVAGLDALLGGGLFERSVTLVSGSAGIGKSTLALQFVVEGVRRGEKCLYVALEEGPAQIMKSAEGLGLPLKRAQSSGLLEFVYLSGRNVRRNQYLSVLVDRIQATKARRLVFDSASHVLAHGDPTEDPRRLLAGLFKRFKALRVTSLCTLELKALHSASANAVDEGFSPMADNLILLQYERMDGGIQPTLTVVKTRGSAHDFGTWTFRIAKGGLSLGERLSRR